MKIEEIIKDSQFKPKFTLTKNIHEVADLINRPHEDYPHRINVTEEMIQFLCDQLFNNECITEMMVRHIHQKIMYDLPTKGYYREIDVYPKGGDKDTYFTPIRIKEGMECLIQSLPTPCSYVEWYHAFQVVHPFRDGNGRVGGVIVAAKSYMDQGIYMAPCQ